MLSLLFTDRGLIALGSLFYLAAFLFVLRFLWQDRQHSPGITFLLVLAGWILQTTGLYLRGLAVGGCPLGNGFEILQFVTWSLILLYLVVGTSFRLSLLGFFSAGLATTLSLLSLALPFLDSTRRVWMEDVSVWVEFHAALALFSYGVFAILALVCGMYLLRDRSLKKKTFGGVYHFLPSIRQLEEMKFRLLATGLLILTLSLFIGLVNWSQLESTVLPGKLGFTIALWAAYLALLLLRWRRLLSPKSLAWYCLGLFLIALLSLGPINASRRDQPPAVSQQAPLPDPPPAATHVR